MLNEVDDESRRSGGSETDGRSLYQLAPQHVAALLAVAPVCQPADVCVPLPVASSRQGRRRVDAQPELSASELALVEKALRHALKAEQEVKTSEIDRRLDSATTSTSVGVQHVLATLKRLVNEPLNSDNEDVNSRIVTPTKRVTLTPSSQSRRYELGTYIARFIETAEGQEEIPLRPAHTRVSRFEISWKSLVNNLESSKESLALKIPEDMLVRLVDVCSEQIQRSAASESTSEDALKGIEAAIAAAVVMLADGISQQVIVEDVLNGVVAILKCQISRTLLPLYDSRSSKTCMAKSQSAQGISDEMLDDESSDVLPTQMRVVRVCSLLAELEQVVARQYIQDPAVLSLLAACYAIFVADHQGSLCTCKGLGQLQASALQFLCSTFQSRELLRPAILQEVISLLRVTQRPPKRTLRQVPVEISAKKVSFIQISTALLVQLVHSTFGSLNSIACTVTVEAFNVALSQHWSQAIQLSRRLVGEMLSGVLHIGSKNQIKESSPDSKAVVIDLCADLTQIVFHPLWPGAEVVLHDVVRFMCQVLPSSNHSSKVRSLAIDCMGNICCALHTRISELEVTPFVVPAATLDLVDLDEASMACPCGMGPDGGQLMLDCDDCHRWFHGRCVGITSSADDSLQNGEWICESCTKRRSVVALMGSDFHSDDVTVMRVLLMHFVVTSGHRMFTAGSQFLLAQWIIDDENNDDNSFADSKVSDIFIRFWSKQAAFGRLAPRGLQLSVDDSHRCALTLRRKSPILRDYESMLAVVMQSLREKQASLRSRGMKSIAAIIASDPSVLERPLIMASVKSALQDRATSVREAAVDLVGKYISDNVRLSEQYFELISVRGKLSSLLRESSHNETVRDKGLSVRKRAIKILRDVCVRFPGHRDYTAICVLLIGRSRDTESIQELVLSTFQQIWFEDHIDPSTRRQSQVEHHQGDDVFEFNFTDQFKHLAQRISKVCVSLRSTEWIVQLIVDLLSKYGSAAASDSHTKTLAPRKNSAGGYKGNIQAVCSDLCTCIVEQLVSLDSDEPSFILPFIKVLNIFGTASPRLISPHLMTLEPFLKQNAKSGNASVDEITHLLCAIFRQAIPFLTVPRESFIEHVVSDLRNLILHHSESVLRAAVPALCIAAQTFPERRKVLWQLLRGFAQFLSNHQSPSSPLQQSIKKAILRSLLAAGLMVKYFDFDFHFTGQAVLSSESSVVPASAQILELCILRLKDNIRMGDILMSRVGLQAAIFIFTRDPTLFLRHREVVHLALASNASTVIQIQALASLFEFLQDEEAAIRQRQQRDQKVRQLEGMLAHAQSPRNSSKLLMMKAPLAQTDTGLVACLMQELVDRMIPLALSESRDLRLSWLQLTKLLIEQRLVNPGSLIPPVLALCSDRDECIRDSAVHLVHVLADTFPSFLRNGVIDGIRLSYRFHARVYKYHLSSEPIEGWSRVYTVLVESAGSNYIQLLSSIVDLVDPSVGSHDPDALAMISFVSHIIDDLPLKKDEPLHILYHLNRFVGRTGSDVLAQLKAVFAPFKDGHMSGEDFDAAAVIPLCLQAIEISILLLLKQHLKRVYSIDQEIVEQWTPHQRSSGSGEVMLSRRPGEISHLNLKPLEDALGDVSGDLKKLYKQYALMKELMKRDTVDVGVSFKKRPVSALQRQRKSAKDEENEIDGIEREEDDSNQTTSTSSKQRRSMKKVHRKRRRITPAAGSSDSYDDDDDMDHDGDAHDHDDDTGEYKPASQRGSRRREQPQTASTSEFKNLRSRRQTM